MVTRLSRVFTARSPRNLAWRCPIGPLQQEKYLGLITLTTVAMATKNHLMTHMTHQKQWISKREGIGWKGNCYQGIQMQAKL